MRLERIVLSCLGTGTSHSEQGKSVSIQRRNDENIMMFLTDSPVARQELRISRACDAVFIYMRHRRRPIIIFVELKGTDIQGASDQIISTIRGFQQLINTDLTSVFPATTDMRAVVVRSGSAPKNQAQTQERFYNTTGITLWIEREQVDLRKFI